MTVLVVKQVPKNTFMTKDLVMGHLVLRYL